LRGLSEPATGEAEAAQRWPNVSGHEVLGELGRGGMGVVYLARQAIQIQEKLTRDHPDNVEYRDGLAGTWDRLGRALRQVGRHDEARAAYRQAIAHMQAALERVPRVSERQRTLGQYYSRLADLERAQGPSRGSGRGHRRVPPADPGRCRRPVQRGLRTRPVRAGDGSGQSSAQ
jgi:hypothetical protein